MPRSCYLVTTLDRVLELPGKNVIFNYTPFARKEYAIEGVSQMKEVGIPLVGRLELPDEYETTPDRCDPKYLVQLGYDPKIDKDAGAQIRLPIRRKHMKRLSVVSWDDICDDSGNKEEVTSSLVRITQQIMDYTKDNDIMNSIYNPADLKDAEDLGKKLTETLKQYDDLRRTHGFTVRDEEALHMARGLFFVYHAGLFGAKAVKEVTDAEQCVLPEMREVHLERAADFYQTFQIMQLQLESETIRALNKSGANPDFIALELGTDEIEGLMSGTITMEQLIDQQAGIDMPNSRNA